jgi:hypothetical protein
MKAIHSFNCWWASVKLQGVPTQKIALFIITDARTADPNNILLLVWRLSDSLRFIFVAVIIYLLFTKYGIILITIIVAVSVNLQLGMSS